jgi:hypothetical protein
MGRPKRRRGAEAPRLWTIKGSYTVESPMETLSPDAPAPMTPEHAQSLSVVMKTIATEFAEPYRETTQRMRDEADARRAHEKAMQADRLAHESKMARYSLWFQIALVLAVAGGALGAMLGGQWSITEKMLIGLLALGFGRSLK